MKTAYVTGGTGCVGRLRSMGMLRRLREFRTRRRARLEDIPLDRYSIRVARQVLDYEDAFKLLHLVLVFEGHEPVDGSDLRITPQHVLPESTVLVAYEGEMLVGTVTITADSPAGIPLDRDYINEINRLRVGGGVVELGSLAVVRRCWRTGVTHLLLLAAYRFARETLGARYCVIGVDPRRAGFYRTFYNFASLARTRTQSGTYIPVLGMWHDVSALPEFVRRRFKKPLASGKTLVEHMLGAALPCIDLPKDVPRAELTRWKMPRAVFRELFVEQCNRIDSLDPAVLRWLARRRSRRTLQGTAIPVSPLGSIE